MRSGHVPHAMWRSDWLVQETGKKAERTRLTNVGQCQCMKYVVGITASLVTLLLRSAYRIRADALEMKGAGGRSSLASRWPRPCTALFCTYGGSTVAPGSHRGTRVKTNTISIWINWGRSRRFVDNYKHGTGGFVTIVNMAMPLPWSFKI